MRLVALQNMTQKNITRHHPLVAVSFPGTLGALSPSSVRVRDSKDESVYPPLLGLDMVWMWTEWRSMANPVTFFTEHLFWGRNRAYATVTI